MPKLSIQEYIDRANERLANGGFSPRVELKGKRLCLRGTFPPKPDSSKTIAYQQRIFLWMGGTPNNVGVAETKAKEVDLAISKGPFNWQDWSRTKPPETVQDWVNRLERDYFTRRDGSSSAFGQCPFNVPG